MLAMAHSLTFLLFIALLLNCPLSLSASFMPASNLTLYFKDCQASVHYLISTEISDYGSL